MIALTCPGYHRRMGSPTAPQGRVLHVNVSRGGVPKRPVAAARVTTMGVEGDRQNARMVHGGPHRAVSILGIEAIARVAAEGHPIAPGTTGENLTTEGFDVSTLPPGTRLAIGREVVLELAAPAAPCETIRESFVDGRFGRLSVKTHADDSRMYARVITEGEVRPGDPIIVRPPLSDSADRHLVAVDLDHAEAAWCRALWRAAEAAGEAVHVIADGDLSVCAAPEIAHPSFNSALGLVMLPHLVGIATRHFDRYGVSGTLLTDTPPLPDLPVVAELGRHVLEPSALRDEPGASETDIAIRELRRDEIGPWADVVIRASDLSGATARAWRAAEHGLAAAAHHRRFVAYLGDEPVGAGSLHTHHGVGWMSAGSVVAEARGRGVQRRLITARVRRAAELRCEVVGASAVAGGASEANLRKLGFRQIATRRDYRYDPRTNPANVS
jgi:MOSC domain-containing protein YiiM/ribosomal protein S18 acetylase RimI-like enzyme